jgi:hypothetical protein
MTENEAIDAAQAYLEKEFSIYLTPEDVFPPRKKAVKKRLSGKWFVNFPQSWELPELGKPEYITLLVDDANGSVDMYSGPGKPIQ